MSIIFDALKRADSQAKRGQVPRLAGAQVQTHSGSKSRLWVLASVFVALGLATWWFVGGPKKPMADTAQNGASATPKVMEALNATSPENQSVPVGKQSVQAGNQSAQAGNQALPELGQNDLSKTDLAALVPPQNGARPTDLTAVTQAATSAPRLSVPTLDAPLTGAAQFRGAPEPALVAEPVVASPTLAQPELQSPMQPVTIAELNEHKIADVVAAPVPVAATVPPESAPEPSLPTVFELEYKVRFELPKMAVSMYVYNAQPQFRFVIIGGKRYSEGEQIDSKVTISKIRADGLECDYQNTRFFYPRQSL